ncbi:RING-type E3 ubiquitin transferase [Malassezia vespertilionis]|nr:RING-type E3 ubiquitin transferase [Malassezia vespertilionis]WFD08027.1 RING-type E3 ubiquitin transferase [Malassezia vespertilionis]
MADLAGVPEVPTCRICRSEEEPGAPLYHPCRCTGSIRYCHQDCLMQWLQHSQKRYCELCKYDFIFHKHYKHTMPDGSFPPWLYARFIGWRALQIAAYILRVVFVGLVWLVLVPYTSYKVWCMYFRISDRIVDAVQGTRSYDATHTQPNTANLLPQRLSEERMADYTYRAARVLVETIYDEVTSEWPRSAFVTAAVMVSFVAVFLLREWVLQYQHETLEHRPAPEEEQPNAARDRIRAAALHAAQARAERMMAADPMHLLVQDLAQNAPQRLDTAWAAEHADAPEEYAMHPAPPQLAPNDEEGSLARAPARTFPHDDDSAWEDESEGGNEPGQVALEPAPLDDDDDDDDDDDEGDNLWDDNADMGEDLDSIMQVIGLRGSLWGFTQSVLILQALVVVIISVFVIFPYLLGRLFGFRFTEALLLPAALLRRITDPVFEFLLDRIAGVLRLTKAIFPQFLRAAPHTQSPVLGLHVPHTQTAPLARFVRHWAGGVARLAQTLQDCTRGTRIWERGLCVVLGHAYIVMGLFLETQLGVYIHGLHLSWPKHAMKQYTTIFKVLAFSVIDLVFFPLFCGTLLEWCLFPLFPGASIARMLGDARAAPFSFILCRWTAGTVYMFHFAQFVTATRAVVRPGVLCWMRDASDPDFHPIREILETRATLQLRKLGDSMIMYSAIAVCLAGASLRAVYYALPNVLPLHWHPLTPVLHVPVDLLLLQLGLRVVLKQARARVRAKRYFRYWWIWAARRVRLSAFLMGDDLPEEHGHVARGGWLARMLGTASEKHAQFIHDGGYARVPANDHPAPNALLFIPTDLHGAPLDEEGRAALEKQRASIATMEKHKALYSVVYIPPNIRRRVLGLLGLLWASVFCAMLGALFAPLLLGRGIMHLAGLGGVHDMYALYTGYVALIALVCVGVGGRRAVLSAQQRTLRVYASHAARLVFHISTALGLVPLLVGLVFHQYLIPVQQYTTEGIPQLNVLHAWALGLILLYLALLLTLFVAPDYAPTLWDMLEMLQTGSVWHVPVLVGWTWLVRPALVLALPLIAAPYLCAAFALWIAGKLAAAAAVQQLYLRCANLGIASLLLGFAAWHFILRRLRYWTSVLRDELFLESTELCNFTEHPAEGPFLGPLPHSMVRGG